MILKAILNSLTPFLIVGALLIGAYGGYRFESDRFEAYKATQQELQQKLAQENQRIADDLRKEKDAEISDINNKLRDAINQLRARPSRAEETATGQDGTGRALSAEDAEFLVREAARADKLRESLDICYKQYDSLDQ